MSVARSYLSVPANRPDRIGKALASGVDAVVVDLQDVIPESEKVAARAALAKALPVARPVLVRVNAPGSEWFAEDLARLQRPGIAGAVLPRAERAEEVVAVRDALPAGRHVLPVIATAAGFQNAPAIAQQPGVLRLFFDAAPFARDMGLAGEEQGALEHFRSQLVLLSRVAGLQPPVESASAALADDEELRADIRRARRAGFGGKCCLHARQVYLINEGFRPSFEELAWARRVLRAAESEPPLRLQAQQVLRDARQPLPL